MQHLGNLIGALCPNLQPLNSPPTCQTSLHIRSIYQTATQKVATFIRICCFDSLRIALLHPDALHLDPDCLALKVCIWIIGIGICQLRISLLQIRCL